MKRLAMFIVAAAVIGMGVSHAQQRVQSRPQTTRSYRSYSVSPSTRGSVQRARGASEATWRHADAKPTGQFHSGR